MVAVQDGLGSVRIEAGAATNSISAAQTYAPFGSPFSTHGTFEGGFGFTGEQVDGSGQVYLRAQYYTPSLGVFPSLDPFEGMSDRPMSLNGYAWVEGNTPNRVDPAGRCADNPTDGSSAVSLTCGGGGGLAGGRGTPSNVITGVFPQTLPTGTGARTLQSPSHLGAPFPGTTGIQAPIISQPIGGLSLSSEAGENALEIAEACNGALCEEEQEPRSRYIYHLAFGLSMIFTPGTTFPPLFERNTRDLRAFTDRLNSQYTLSARYLTVHNDNMWYRNNLFRHGEAPLSTTPHFPLSFEQATIDRRVVQLHFNIEGINFLFEDDVNDLREFAIYNGNQGQNYMTPGQTITVNGRQVTFYAIAWELYKIASNPTLCNRTLFYRQGTSDITPDVGLQSYICNMI
jgi:RHS repeat-associated protein